MSHPLRPALLLLTLPLTVEARSEPDAEPEAQGEGAGDHATRRADRRDKVDGRRIARLEKAYRQRTLRNHPFIDPQLLDSALPTSHAGSTLGAAAVIQQVEGSDGEASSQVYAAGLGELDAGVRFGRWIGVQGRIGGAAGLGSGETLLDAGALAAWNWSAGANVRVVHADEAGTALSITPQAFGTNGSGVVLRPGLDAVVLQVEDGTVDLLEASRYMTARVDDVGGGASVNLAQSFGAAAGLQLSLAGGAQRSTLRYYDGEERADRSGEALLSGGLALSFDANPVPIATLLEYRYDHAWGLGPAAGLQGGGHNIGFGLYLNGMTNAVGLEVKAQVGPGSARVGAGIGLQSYF